MMNVTVKTMAVVWVGLMFCAGQAMAGRINVTVKNLTNGIYFTPLLITAHDGHTRLFEVGTPATDALRAMAEGGNISLLLEMLGGPDKDTIANPVGDLLGPGDVIGNIKIDTRRGKKQYLSLTAMMLPTNDGFVGLDSVPIPRRPGLYSYYLFGYDAGTEANDELITGGGSPGEPGIPAAPGGYGGTGGVGVAGPDANPKVHIHRGIVGDLDPTGGISDLDSSVHRWLNPVAEVVIEVQHHKKDKRDDD